ncbi:MAG: SH3 domain-containing protein [Anaerolineales bacterium]
MMRHLTLLACLITISGCVLPVDPLDQPPAAVTVVEAQAESAADCPPTAIPTVLSCPTAPVVETPAAELRSASVSSGNLTLRSGPSVAHPALGTYPMGAAVKILGKVPGGSWLAVSVPGGSLGWMYAQYLGVDVSDPLGDVAELEPAQSLSIHGRVTDDTGQPVQNVGVVVALGGAVDYPDFSDAEGRFVVFVPDSQSGPWAVSIQGVGCRSRLVDQDCQLVNHILSNPQEIYERGQGEELVFVYEATDMRLRGQVVDASGNAYDGAGIFATRDDGAYVTGRADASGFFDIPITSGMWKLRATRGQMITIEVSPNGYEGDLTLVGVRN